MKWIHRAHPSIGAADPGVVDIRVLHDPDRTLPVDPDLVAESLLHRDDPRRHRRAARVLLLVVACSGAAGALARYALGRLVVDPVGRFPWSTFTVNVTGSFAIGFVLVLLAQRFAQRAAPARLVATGFLGAYTTFSTYTVDADLLFRAHDVATGVAYVLASVVAGLGAVVLGMGCAKAAIRVDDFLNEQLDT